MLIGSHPFKDDKGSELVKLNILKLLNEKYGVTEEDFLSDRRLRSGRPRLRVPRFDRCFRG